MIAGIVAAWRDRDAITLISKAALVKLRLMTTPAFLLPLLLIFLTVFPALAQKRKQPMTGSAARGAASSGMLIAPDLAQRLAKFKRVPMPFHSTGLTAREQKMVEKLVDASRYLEDIYWRQSDPEGLTLYQSLAGS